MVSIKYATVHPRPWKAMLPMNMGKPEVDGWFLRSALPSTPSIRKG